MEDDFAVVVGLQNYPGLDDPGNGQPALSGSENDALGFKAWLESPAGGAVPEQNIKMILSSDFPGPYSDLMHVLPAEIEIASAFEKLRDISKRNSQNGLGSRIGRRLYIFMSGHGIAPSPYGLKNDKEACLLMSNADPENLGATRYNISGVYAADWFGRNDCFDEIFLFMDCCRDYINTASLNLFFPATGNTMTTKRFYAFACRWNSRAREKIIDGQMQGVFTKTLLLGLNGACADSDPANPGNGIITGSSLKGYLYQNMKEFFDPQFIKSGDTIEPDVDFYPKANDARDIIILPAPVQKFPVKIQISQGINGQISISDTNFSNVFQFGKPDAAPEERLVSLPRGTYQVAGIRDQVITNKTFIVKGIEAPGKEAIVVL